jgi:hypothetical protein
MTRWKRNQIPSRCLLAPSILHQRTGAVLQVECNEIQAEVTSCPHQRLVLGQPGAFLSSPNIVLIFWGDPSTPTTGNFWNDHPDFLSAGLTFFIEFIRGYNVDRLSQYGVGIANICWFGSLIAAYPAGGLTQIVTDAVANGTIPQPGEFDSMMYVYVIDPTSPHSGFSNGQHDTFSSNGMSGPFAFAPFSPNLNIPAISGPPGVDGPTWWSQQTVYTSAISHEIYEVMTDPAPNSGWTDANWPPGFTSECCDICEDVFDIGGQDDAAPFQYGPWNIETYWSNLDGVCILGYANNWTNVGSPGVEISGAVALGQNAAPGGLQLFAADTAGNLWTVSGNAPDDPSGVWAGGEWNTLANDANIVAGPPVAAFNPTTELLEVFAITKATPTTPSSLWHIYQTAADGSWSAGELLGGPQGCEIVGNVSVGQNGPNPNNANYQALEVFLIGSDGQLHHIWQLGAWKGWSGWGDSLGAPPPGIAPITPPFNAGLGSGPCVGSNADGRLEVFVIGNDNSIWHRWQVAPNSGWSAWSQLVSFQGEEALSGVLASSRETNGCLAVFAYTVNGVIFYMDQSAPDNGWGQFTELMPMELSFASPPAASSCNQPPQLQLFVIGDDSALWTTQQGDDTNPPAIPGVYQPWRFIGSPPTSQVPNGLVAQQIPAAIGTLVGFTVCAMGTDGNVWSLSQMAPLNPWGPLITKTSWP